MFHSNPIQETLDCGSIPSIISKGDTFARVFPF